MSLLTACSTFLRLDMTKISLGMDKEQVQTAMRRKPDDVVAAKQYPNGQLEVVQYSGQGSIIWLYFFNGKLVQFGQPGNWEQEAAVILKIRG